jgi:hypothetical protein
VCWLLQVTDLPASWQVEPMDSLKERTRLIQQITKDSEPFKDVTSIVAQVQPPKPGTGGILNKAPAPAPAPAAPEITGDKTGQDLYMAFHTKEITFMVENEF